MAAEAQASASASAPPEPVAFARSPYDQARIDKWIRDRLVYWDSSCCHCRRPVIPGQLRTLLSGDNGKSKFHQECAAVWLTEQEPAAVRALGLERE